MKMSETPKKILVINGPNLNLLGVREPEIYGNCTLAEIEGNCQKKAKFLGVDIEFFQSNIEGELIEKIQDHDNYDALIINAAAFTHTSVAIRDAISMLKVPAIELHISNIFKREGFRHVSYLSDVVDGVICGLGAKGYELAVEYLAEKMK